MDRATEQDITTERNRSIVERLREEFGRTAASLTPDEEPALHYVLPNREQRPADDNR